MKFNTERLLCGTKFGLDTLNSTERKLQEAMDQVSHEACDNYDIKNNNVVNQPAHRTPYSELAITVARQRLGSTLLRAEHIDDQAVTARIA